MCLYRSTMVEVGQRWPLYSRVMDSTLVASRDDASKVKRVVWTMMGESTSVCWPFQQEFFLQPRKGAAIEWTAKQGITEIRAPLEICIEPTMVVGSDTTTRPSTLKTGWQTDRVFEAGEKKLCKGWQHRHREHDFCDDNSSDDDRNDKRTMPLWWVLGKQSWQLKESTVAVVRLISTTKTTTGSPT